MTENDPVHRPAHYANSNIEVANFIADRELDYFLGCVVKYVSRAGIKDTSTELEDLQKAEAYLKMKIRMVQNLDPIAPRVEVPFCNECEGPYNESNGYAWLGTEQYGGHWDTCPNRPKNVRISERQMVSPMIPVYKLGALVIPQCAGVTYMTNIMQTDIVQATASGEWVIKPGSTITVTARPRPGYEFPEGVANDWVYDF